MAYKFQNWWGEGHKTLWHFLFYLWRKKGGILKPMRGREVLLLLTVYTPNSQKLDSERFIFRTTVWDPHFQAHVKELNKIKNALRKKVPMITLIRARSHSLQSLSAKEILSWLQPCSVIHRSLVRFRLGGSGFCRLIAHTKLLHTLCHD